MRKKLKKSLSLVLAVIMLLGLLPMTSFAASGHYGNATYSDQEGYFYTAGNEKVYGWKVSVTNRSTGHEPTSFDLWFPDPFNFNTTYSGHVRYTAGEHGTGSYEEKLQATYYVSDYNYGYVLNDLPTEEELESVGIRADEGYAFNHYEITYWTRSSSSDSFTEKTDNFYPGDVMPFDRNLQWNYEEKQGYLEIKVIYAEDSQTPTPPTIPDDNEVDITHEVYIPAGYDCGMTFDLTSGATLSNLQVVSADSETATIEGELINSNTRASVTIDAHKTGDTAVYCMFEGGDSGRTVEKILVHVYDPNKYQLEVAEGETDTFTHRVTVNDGTVGTNAILFDMTPQINSGSEFVTISPEEGGWVQTVKGSAAVVIPVTGTAEGQAVIETQFSFVTREAKGQAIHLFVDVVNVTVTEPTPPAPPVDEDWKNVNLKIAAYKKETDSLLQSKMIDQLFESSDSKLDDEAFRNTVTFAEPVYHTDTQKWTMDVTVDGYLADDAEPFTHVVNYFLRGTSYKGWGLAPDQEDPQTITLTYYERDGWCDENGDTAEMIFYVAPQDTSTAPDAPGWTDIYNLGNVVTIDCTNENKPTHVAINYTIAENTEGINDSYVVSEVAESGGEWTCTVTIYPVQSYLTNYNKNYLGHTYRTGQEGGKTLTLTWEADQWTTTDTVTFDVECAPVVSPVITDFTKSLVTTATVGDLATSPDVTIPEPGQKIIIPANGTVTLLYKLTVHGVAGTAFTITDNGVKQIIQQDCNAVLTGNEIKGTIPNNGIATIYVTKTFTASDITEDGYVTNTASIAADGGVADDKDTATETTPAEEGKPSAPGEDDLPADLKTGAVKVDCTNTTAEHDDATYGLIMGGYTSNVTGTAADGWECTITIDTNAYAAHYDLQKGYAEGTHTATTAPAPTITLTWDKTTKAWELAEAEKAKLPVTVEVKCTTPEPAITDFTKELVYADSMGDIATGTDVMIPARGQTIQIPADGEVTLLYKLTVTGKAGASFTITDEGVKQIIQQDCGAVLSGNTITGTILSGGTATIYVTKTFDADDIEDGKVTNTATITSEDGVDKDVENPKVETPAEETAPSAPSETELETLLNGKITVDCTTEGVNHPDATYGLIEGGYSRPAAGVTGSSTDGWKYVVTINADVYVNDYDTTKLALPIGTHTQTGDAYTITLTWDGQGWSCGEHVKIEAACSLYTLTYNANGGTFTAGTTFTVKGLEDTAAYQLGEETGYAAPTKGTDVFLGWTTDPSASGKVYGAGQQLPEVVTEVSIPETTIVYAVWGADSNGDKIADAQQILITPADITVYTGGTGYDGVVSGTDNNGIPEPGYYFTLPYELNQTLQQMTGSQVGPVNLANHIRLTDRTDSSRQWILQLYDGTTNSAAYGKYIYRLAETATGNSPAKLVIKDGSTIITDDELYITNDALYKTYTMSLDTGAAAAGNITVEISADGNSWIQPTAGAVNGLCLGEGTLTVRGTHEDSPTLTTDVGSSQSDVVENDEIANEESQTTITAVAPEDTNYTINGSDVTTGGSIGLLTDGLLPNNVLSGYLDEHNLTDENTKVDYQYLDLVDMSNGNAYVTASEALDIYWKLPAGADPNGDISVVHFNGLDRNYEMDQLKNLIGTDGHKVEKYSIDDGSLTLVEINGEQYLKFATSSFSPFALVYDAKDEPVVEKVTVTFDSGKHGDFGWYHVTSKDVELTKGGKLAAYQIPTVYEDAGYEFIGWYKQGSASWKLYSDAQLLTMEFNSDATFIAQYKYVGGPSVDDEYDVVYNANFTDGGVPRRQGYDKGETVTVSENKWFERDGYIFVGWNTEADGTGDSYDPDDTFKMPGRDVYLYAQWQKEKPGPDDTGVSRWLETEDHNAYLTGYPDSTFGADRNMTRAEVAQMFYSLLKNKNVMITTSFSDVSNDAWYATAVKTMASLGMMSGYPDGTFRPDEPITRAEFATVALAFAYEPDNARCSYLDVSTSAWYYTYVAQATTYGWIGGYPDGTFRPNNSITRVEVCVIVNNMLGRTPDEDYIDRNEDELVNFVDLSDRYWGYYTIMEATNGHEYTGNYSNETWKDVV